MIREFKGEHRWLSNFAPCKIMLDGEEYDSVENAYQASKTLNHNERMKFKNITPGQAKRLGRKITIRDDWSKVKLSIMYSLLIQKYANPPYKNMLIETGYMRIEEGNLWNDTFWGVCLETGKGQNNLGKMIMEIRKNFYVFETLFDDNFEADIEHMNHIINLTK